MEFNSFEIWGAAIRGFRSCVALAGMITVAGGSAMADHITFEDIADTFAGEYVSNGQAVGVGVAIIDGPGKPKFFTYGNAVAATDGMPAKPLKPGSLFWMGSVSKVITMNLLGQRIHSGDIRPNQALSDFSAQIGSMKPLTSQMTIRQLASFTGGVRDTPPICDSNNQPLGCFPNSLPSISTYPVPDFAKYIQNLLPRNFQNCNPPCPYVDSLPTLYNYSNYSAALIGLLIGGMRDEPLSNPAVRGWFKAVKKDILEPLDMKNTFLTVPSNKRSREVAGYDPATASASVENGRIVSTGLKSYGSNYSEPPNVEVIGGGGTGAVITSTIGKCVEGSPDCEDYVECPLNDTNCQVVRLNVQNNGSGYVGPPVIAFEKAQGASADALISDGKVMGVKVLSGGSGLKSAPKVTISGGQPNGGAPAQLQAIVSGGRVTYVRVTDPGSGYADRLALSIEPGAPTSIPRSSMAPAGFLVSNLRNMSVFARAAFAKKGKLSARKAKVRKGFKISERPYVCTNGPIALSNCPHETRSGYAWMIAPSDTNTGRPEVISKDGGIPGFSTYVTLMPDLEVGVVVSVNTRPVPGGKVPPAVLLGQNILNAIYYECKRYGFGHGGCQ